MTPLQATQPSSSPSSNFYLHRLDLRPGLQAIYAGFHRDCIQRKIRRAEREGLTITEVNTAETLTQFYALVVRTRRRQGLPPQPIEWFKALTECFGDALRIRIASKNNRAVAGILTLQHKQSLVYKYGASDDRCNNLGGMVYLFWAAIQDAIKSGVTELDLGRSDLDNPGLAAFKEHWGAARFPLHYWRFPVAEAAHAPALWLRGLSKHVCTFIPDRSLISLGTLLYRHVG